MNQNEPPVSALDWVLEGASPASRRACRVLGVSTVMALTALVVLMGTYFKDDAPPSRSPPTSSASSTPLQDALWVIIVIGVVVNMGTAFTGFYFLDRDSEAEGHSAFPFYTTESDTESVSTGVSIER